MHYEFIISRQCCAGNIKFILYLVIFLFLIVSSDILCSYELWKPYLRAKMEEDMKKVSIGTKRKSDFLTSCLQEVKQVFLDVSHYVTVCCALCVIGTFCGF